MFHINLYSFVSNSTLKLTDVLGLFAPGIEGASAVATINRIQEESRVDNKQAHSYCDNYLRYKGARCCRGDKNVEDEYIYEASAMCHKFVEKYSRNNQVIKPVECVAKCLSEAEAENINIADCCDRNAERLIKHFYCYASCSFFLFDANSVGTPEGGWDMGFNKMLPDFIESYKNKIISFVL